MKTFLNNVRQNYNDSCNNFSKKARTVCEFLLCITHKSLLYVITPGYYAYWSAYVLPEIVMFFNLELPAIIILFVFHTYLFLNVIVNMIANMMSDTSVQKYLEYGSRYYNDEIYCVECDALQPNGSWHCSRCNTCILGRDRHCEVFGNCIGQQNKRYYILYITYASTMCLSCAVWATMFLIAKYGVISFFWEMGKALVYTGPTAPRYCKRRYDDTAVFVLISLVIVAMVGSLAYQHMRNVFKGLTFRERKLGKPGSPDWRMNMKKVFGINWQLAIFWPFVRSPLIE